jgi:hypothetical protein
MYIRDCRSHIFSALQGEENNFFLFLCMTPLSPHAYGLVQHACHVQAWPKASGLATLARANMHWPVSIGFLVVHPFWSLRGEEKWLSHLTCMHRPHACRWEIQPGTVLGPGALSLSLSHISSRGTRHSAGKGVGGVGPLEFAQAGRTHASGKKISADRIRNFRDIPFIG